MIITGKYCPKCKRSFDMDESVGRECPTCSTILEFIKEDMAIDVELEEDENEPAEEEDEGEILDLDDEIDIDLDEILVDLDDKVAE